MSQPEENFTCAGKIVVITGGRSGIWFSFAQLVHSKGAKVLIADLKLTAEADEWVLASATQDGSDARVVFKKCDVTRWSDLKALPETANVLWGSVPDICIPAAGTFEPPWSNFYDDPEDTQYASVSINIAHPIQLARIAIRSFLQNNKKGAILNIGSDAGIFPFAQTPLYTTTKHAVVAFTRCLALLEAQSGIKVVAICLAGVATPMFTVEKMREFGEDADAFLRPEEVALGMLQLLEQSAYSGGGGGSVVLMGKNEGLVAVPVQSVAGFPQSKLDLGGSVQADLDRETNSNVS